MKKFLIGVMLFALLTGVAAVTLRHQDDTQHTRQENKTTDQIQMPNTILMQKFSFSPAKLTVKKGSKVTWINMDDAHHDVSPTGGASDFIASTLLAKGESYEFTFSTAGSYTYQCSPHPYMKGTIEVTE